MLELDFSNIILFLILYTIKYLRNIPFFTKLDFEIFNTVFKNQLPAKHSSFFHLPNGGRISFLHSICHTVFKFCKHVFNKYYDYTAVKLVRINIYL